MFGRLTLIFLCTCIISLAAPTVFAYKQAPPATAIEAAVVRVIDGDTFIANVGGYEERMRMIGVDTPETVHPSRPVEAYGREASEFTKALLPPGTRVLLEFDVERQDSYQRLLAYVYLPPNTFVNATLVEQGYAQILTIPPNVRYADLFLRLQREAREAGRGLWGEGPAGSNAPRKPGVHIAFVDLEAEVVVIRNDGPTRVGLTGWILVSEVGGKTFAFPPGSTLEPGDDLRVLSGRGATHLPPAQLLWTTANVWNNGGDPAVLIDDEGREVSRYP